MMKELQPPAIQPPGRGGRRARRALVLFPFSFFLAAQLAAAAVAAERENPLRNARIGDWVCHANVAQTPGGPLETITKRTVTAKDATSITFLTETTVAGQTHSQEVKIPLDQAHSPYPAPRGAKVEVIAEGDETLSVGGKEYKCHWVQSRATYRLADQEMASASKVWTCRDVPFDGVVKLETTAMGMTSTMALTGCGRGK